jgi:ABC-type multidrug transport system fused ATPase/permease subunit
MPEESRRSRGEDEDVMDDVLLHHRGDSAIPTSSTHSMGESVGKSSTGILRGSGGGGGGGSGSTILRVEGNSGDLNAMLTTVFEHAARLSRRAADAFLFMWMVPLLELGNERPLRQGDLYELDPSDRAVSVFALFKRCWREQEKAGDAASLAMAFFHAFGLPFVGAGALKLVHDMCLFVGPQLLNRLILFLSDPHEPQSTGYKYVALLFLANVVMSLCLRQYFWWCYRVGMRLRSAVVTSVYHKTLVVNAGVMARRSMGETTNLMSIDATRLQELTPYLHAIWYSFVQIGIALYFLWEQVGPSCLGGIAVILLAIPMTGRISKYLKSVQKDMSKVRDERVKLGNEVLAGMKVIKLQAWEQEFQTRLNEVRDRELALFRKYILAQSLSGAVYTAVPILVGIFTFILYVALGNELHVSTALTSLALFEILRFPLYMLPNVLNSVVEAKVSVDRVQSYLLEPEKAGVPEAPLRRPGVRLAKATVVYEGVGRSVDREEYDREFVQKRRGRPLAPYLAESDDEFAGMPEPNPIMRWLDTARAYLAGLPVIGPYLPFVNSAVPTGSGTSAKVYLSESEYDTVLLRAELEEANGVIDSLIRQSMSPHGGVQLAAATGAAGGVSSFLSTDSTEAGGVLKSRSHSLDVYDSAEAGAGISRTGSSSSNNGTPDAATRATSERILALSRVDLAARSGELVAVVGLVSPSMYMYLSTSCHI